MEQKLQFVSSGGDLDPARTNSAGNTGLTDKLLPLFAFGTLRTGQCNHHYLAGRFERSVPARLEGYTRVAELMIGRADGCVVDGELFFLDLSRYAETLAGCDELEEIPPGTLRGAEYQRKRVTVLTEGGPVDAWAYVTPELE